MRGTAILLLAAGLLAGCGNDCSFGSRCNGNTLEVCGAGPDQLVNRKVHATVCAEPNPVCVETRVGGSTEAGCFASAGSCSDGLSRCADGGLLLACDTTFQRFNAGSCSASRTCQADPDAGASCR